MEARASGARVACILFLHTCGSMPDEIALAVATTAPSAAARRSSCERPSTGVQMADPFPSLAGAGAATGVCSWSSQHPAPWAVAVPRSGGAPSQPPQYGGGASSADGDGSRSAPSLRAVSPRNKFVDQSRRLSQQTTATPGAGDGTALAAPSRLSSGTAHAPELPCGLAAEIGVEKLDWAEYPDAAGSAAEYGEVPWPPPGTVTPGSSTSSDPGGTLYI